jgi:hypothetical protein
MVAQCKAAQPPQRFTVPWHPHFLGVSHCIPVCSFPQIVASLGNKRVFNDQSERFYEHDD